MRFKQRLCRWFGHREVHAEYDVSCGRCLVLLRGPLNFTAADRARRHLTIPPEQAPR
jgi:hypothetical protein